MLAIFAIEVVWYVQFDRGAGGYLKRAADANTIDLAERELSVALKYIESNNMTSGYTSVLYRTPDEEIGYWYENLARSAKELCDVPPDADQTLKSNVLMKLRETLTDTSSEGTVLTVPSGISKYPHNKAMAYALIIFSIMACISIIKIWWRMR
jgi:hypothetical protein